MLFLPKNNFAAVSVQETASHQQAVWGWTRRKTLKAVKESDEGNFRNGTGSVSNDVKEKGTMWKWQMGRPQRRIITRNWWSARDDYNPDRRSDCRDYPTPQIHSLGRPKVSPRFLLLLKGCMLQASLLYDPWPSCELLAVTPDQCATRNPSPSFTPHTSSHTANVDKFSRCSSPSTVPSPLLDSMKEGIKANYFPPPLEFKETMWYN